MKVIRSILDGNGARLSSARSEVCRDACWVVRACDGRHLDSMALLDRDPGLTDDLGNLCVAAAHACRDSRTADLPLENFGDALPASDF